MVKFTVPLSDILGSAYYRYELTSSDYNPNVNSDISLTCTCKNVLGNPIADKGITLYKNGSSSETSTTNANGIATFTVHIYDAQTLNFTIEDTSITVKPKQFISQLIPNGSNLNDIVAEGMYYCNTNVNASEITNKPIDNLAFSLLVEKTAYVKQTFTTYTLLNPRTFVRTSTRNNNVVEWGSWYEIPTNSTSQWTTQTLVTYGTFYVNTAMRLCEFHYSRSGYNFSSTNAVTLHTGAIPSAYRPKHNVNLGAYIGEIGGQVTTEGNIQVKSYATGSKNIYLSGFWHY